MNDMETLGTALPKEIQRCEELLKIYQGMFPVGIFAWSMIKQKVDDAKKATAEGDVVAMLRCYHGLKGCE